MVQLNHEMLIPNEMQNFHCINLLPLQTNEYRNPWANDFFFSNHENLHHPIKVHSQYSIITITLKLKQKTKQKQNKKHAE